MVRECTYLQKLYLKLDLKWVRLRGRSSIFPRHFRAAGLRKVRDAYHFLFQGRSRSSQSSETRGLCVSDCTHQKEAKNFSIHEDWCLERSAADDGDAAPIHIAGNV